MLACSRLVRRIVVAACGLAAGCGLATFKDSRHVEVPHVVGSAIRVETENGSIAVEAAGPAPQGGAGAVRIDAEIFATSAERAAAVKIVAERDAAGTLSVRAEWPGGSREGSEGCSFQISVPDYARLDAASKNGAVRAVGAGGAVEARSSNGRITVVRAKGPVKAVTRNGAVEVEEAGATVDAHSDNGSIMVALAPGNSQGVVLETSNGSIRFTVGPTYQGTVDAQAGNGRIAVTGLDDAKLDRPTQTSARVTIGTGGDVSLLRTKNGSMRIERSGK